MEIRRYNYASNAHASSKKLEPSEKASVRGPTIG
jgi:hypothetical protein